MAHVLVRHKVADFAKWKKSYNTHAPSRKQAGLKEAGLWRNQQDASEVFILFKAASLAKAKKFAGSEDLKAAMQTAGVVDKPDLYFLK